MPNEIIRKPYVFSDDLRRNKGNVICLNLHNIRSEICQKSLKVANLESSMHEPTDFLQDLKV